LDCRVKPGNDECSYISPPLLVTRRR
jgi:hypothetical protein